jgi:hypothetical protein
MSYLDLFAPRGAAFGLDITLHNGDYLEHVYVQFDDTASVCHNAGNPRAIRWH